MEKKAAVVHLILFKKAPDRGTENHKEISVKITGTSKHDRNSKNFCRRRKWRTWPILRYYQTFSLTNIKYRKLQVGAPGLTNI